MAGLILATVTPDNTPGGGVLTFYLPVGLFVVVATILYLLFSRPHRRTPARRVLASAHAGPPDPAAARGVAVGGGLSGAAGGGVSESAVEAAGAHRAAAAQTGSVAGTDGGAAEAGQPDPDSSASAGTTSAGTAPGSTAAEGTAPEGTAPGSTASEGTAPGSTAPDGTARDGTEADE